MDDRHHRGRDARVISNPAAMSSEKRLKRKSAPNFWKKLKRPFFCLAPMSDVTDAAFRKIVARHGKPAVLWTEFVSADGLCNPVGRKKLAPILKFSPAERPIVAQVFGANPAKMEKACRLISRLGFDGIDINMGCPERSVVRQGAGAALIRTPALAQAIIKSALAGARGLPISVKTRVGFNKEEIDVWIPEILKENISALTIHARTKKQASRAPANWDYVKRVVKLVKTSGKNIPVIGNGDIKSLAEGREKAKATGCDGVMVGRSVLGNPWFFSGCQIQTIPPEEKLKVLLEHAKLFEKLFGREKNFAVMKKHFKAYVNGFAGAKELRARLMETDSYGEVEQIIKNYLKLDLN